MTTEELTLTSDLHRLQILSDTKSLQKEINSLTGKLDRTFAVTDEMVFKVPQVHLLCTRNQLKVSC